MRCISHIITPIFITTNVSKTRFAVVFVLFCYCSRYSLSIITNLLGSLNFETRNEPIPTYPMTILYRSRFICNVQIFVDHASFRLTFAYRARVFTCHAFIVNVLSWIRPAQYYCCVTRRVCFVHSRVSVLLLGGLARDDLHFPGRGGERWRTTVLFGGCIVSLSFFLVCCFFLTAIIFFSSKSMSFTPSDLILEDITEIWY